MEHALNNYFGEREILFECPRCQSHQREVVKIIKSIQYFPNMLAIRFNRVPKDKDEDIDYSEVTEIKDEITLKSYHNIPKGERERTYQLMGFIH